MPPKLLALPWQPFAPGQTDESGYRISVADDGNNRWFRLAFTAATLPHRMTYLVAATGAQVYAGWDYPPETAHEALHAAISLLHSRVLSLALTLRGLLCLHGAALAWEHGAFAILGNTGAGKSTLAASLLDAGCRLMADDKVVVNACDTGWSVAPGMDQLRLWPDTLVHMERDPDALVRVFRRNDKRFLPVAERAATSSLPLRAIYILSERSIADVSPVLEKLTPAAALFHLLNQRLGASMRTPTQMADDMNRLKQIAQSVPTYLVQRPDNLARLPQTVEMMLDDIQRHALPEGAQA